MGRSAANRQGNVMELSGNFTLSGELSPWTEWEHVTCYYQDLGADALEILDELVECEIAILQPHIKTAIGFCLEVNYMLAAVVIDECTCLNNNKNVALWKEAGPSPVWFDVIKTTDDDCEQ